MTELTLRAPVAADLPALAALGVAAFVAKFGELYRPEDLIPFLVDTHSEQAWQRDLADPQRRTMVAFRGEVPVGWAKLALAASFAEHARGRRTMELKQLYTAPHAQGSGIGKALMDWAMAEFATLGADEVQLSVWFDNTGAQRFYARYGFAKVADVTFAVGEQRDHEFLFARAI